MDEFVSSVPNTLFGWIGICLAIIFGMISLLNRRNSETDKEREELIAILKDKLALFETVRAEVDKLAAENAILKELVLSKDTDSQKLRDAAMEAIRQIEFLYEQKINEIKAQNVEAYVSRPLREHQEQKSSNQGGL